MERCSPKEIWKTNAISSKKIGSNLQVADKSLAVAFKKPWNLLAGFHADSAASTARPREICEKPKWRREGDSNPRYLLGIHAFQACALNHSAISPPKTALWPTAPRHASIFQHTHPRDLPPPRRSGKIPAMKKHKTSDPLRPYSSIVFDGPERAAARSMLYPVGFKPEDFKKPLIGVASTWGNVTPCNMHIDKLALESEKGANEAGGKAIVFNTITISDGISMGSEGMKYSLVSREVIAD